MSKSWAEQQAHSINHLHIMHNLAWADSDAKFQRLMKAEQERTGTQTASEGPAKPSIVGSNPTPCSKHCNLTGDIICPDCKHCSTVEIEPGVYHCLSCKAKFTVLK